MGPNALLTVAATVHVWQLVDCVRVKAPRGLLSIAAPSNELAVKSMAAVRGQKMAINRGHIATIRVHQ
ncbi:hypothetical protein [Carnimonas bestiolae]|uniref:hypothetical protein n=1 Tax=Carnimonas bestiolae TaxID=3402172 RepID=UPI003EDC9069